MNFVSMEIAIYIILLAVHGSAAQNFDQEKSDDSSSYNSGYILNDSDEDAIKNSTKSNDKMSHESDFNDYSVSSNIEKQEKNESKETRELNYGDTNTHQDMNEMAEQDWCDKQDLRKKYWAFVEDNSGQRTFSEEFLKLIRSNKEAKKIVDVLTTQFKDMSGKFFKVFDGTASVYDVKQMITCLMDLSITNIPKVISAFTDTFYLQHLEFVKYADIIRILSTDSLSKLINNIETSVALGTICRKLIHRLPCNLKYTVLKELKKSNKTCLNIDDVHTKTKLANLIVDTKSVPRMWEDKLWVDLISLYMDVFIAEQHLLSVIPNQILLRMWMNITNHCKEFKEGQHVLMKRIEDAFEILDADSKQKFKPIMKEIAKNCSGDASKYSSKKERVEEYKHGRSQMSPKEKAEIARDLPAVLNKTASQYTKDEIVQYIEFLTLNKRFVNELNVEELEDAICDIGRLEDLSYHVLRTVAWVMKMKIMKYKGPNAFQSLGVEDIKCLGNLLGVLSKDDIRNINRNELHKAISGGLLKSINFQCTVARIILEKYKQATQNTEGNFKAGELMNFGPMLKCFNASDWKQCEISVDVIDAIGSVSNDKDLPKTVIASILRKVDQQENKTKVMDRIAYSNLGKYLESHEKGEIIANRLKTGHEVPEQFLECTCIEAKRCFNGLLEVLGNFSTWELDWIEKLKGSTLWHGINSKMLADLPEYWLENYELKYFESQNCSSVKQMESLRKRYKEVKKTIDMEMLKDEKSDVANDEYDSALNRNDNGDDTTSTKLEEEDVLLESPVTLIYQPVERLTSSDEKSLVAACKKMGEVDSNRVPNAIIKSKLEACKDVCTNVTTTSEHYDECGSLLCGMKPDKIATMDVTFIQNHATDLCEKCEWNDAQKKALLKRGQEIAAFQFNMDAVDVCAIGVCIKALTKNQLYSTAADVLLTSKKCVSDSTETKQLAEGKKEEWGYRPSNQQLNESLEDDTKYGDRMLGIFAENNRRRRKRSEELTISCDDLLSLKTAVVALTANDISLMPNRELEDCLEMIGEITTWKTEQKQAFVEKLKGETMFGHIDTWSTETIMLAGTVIQGLTLEEIGTLQLDLTLMESLGQHDGWTETQKKEMMQSFLKMFGKGVDELSADTMRVLGHFICGMTTDQIASIHFAVYKNASENIGQVTSCNELQLIEWAKKAKMAFGEVSTWDDATVQLVGSVIGGLMEKDLLSMTEDHIDSIQPDIVPYIPPSTLEKFSSTQLDFFSSNQVQSLTSSQMEALDEDQLQAVKRIMSTITGGLDNGGQIMISSSICDLTNTVMASVIVLIIFN